MKYDLNIYYNTSWTFHVYSFPKFPTDTAVLHFARHTASEERQFNIPQGESMKNAWLFWTTAQ